MSLPNPDGAPRLCAQDSETLYVFEVAAMPPVNGAAQSRGLRPNNWRDSHTRIDYSGDRRIVVFLGER